MVTILIFNSALSTAVALAMVGWLHWRTSWFDRSAPSERTLAPARGGQRLALIRTTAPSP